MVIKKTKISIITPIVAIIVAIASMVSIGGGIGLGQQQTALAQVLDSRDIGGDEANLGDIEDAVRDSLKQEEDDKPLTVEDLLANILEDVDEVAIGGPVVACCDPDCLRLVPNCEPPPPPVVVS